MEPSLMMWMPSLIETIIFVTLGLGILAIVGIVICVARVAQRKGQGSAPRTAGPAGASTAGSHGFEDLENSDVHADQLVEFVGKGGTVAVSARGRDVEEILAIVRAAGASGGTVVIRDTDHLSREDLGRVAIARRPRGKLALE